MFEIIENGNVTTPKGFIAGGTNVGIKTDVEELDLGILWSELPDTTCSGVFTSNSVVSPSVTASKTNLSKKKMVSLLLDNAKITIHLNSQTL